MKKGIIMSTRKHIRTITVHTEETEGAKQFVLEYYVLSREISVESICTNTYGIEILKRGKTAHGTLHVEYRKVFDVFCTEAEAYDACLLLARNTVTPIAVRDILEQLIGTDEIVCEEYEIAAV